MAHFDFVVIGAGPAGKCGAVQAAKSGKSVLLIDNREKVGGVSVHTGTIPSKTLRETALNLSGWRERWLYGRSYRPKRQICGTDLQRRISQTLNVEVEALEHQLLRNRVRTMIGKARLLSPTHVQITRDHAGQIWDEVVTTDRILLAVGSVPFHPEGIPFDGLNIHDSDTILKISDIPPSLTVVGAGVIGLEYATAFQTLDVAVTIVEPRRTILDFLDPDLVQSFICQLRDRGVSFRLGAKVDKVALMPGGGVLSTLDDGRTVRSAALLYTAGRVGATHDLGLESCGIEADHRGRIAVDPLTFQTLTPGVYAAGDVIGFPSLASTSLEQGRLATCHALNIRVSDQRPCHPLGIYSVPEMSAVGMTEVEAISKGYLIECGVSRFKDISRGHIMGISDGFLKLIFEVSTGKLLGTHVIGEGATELVHIGQAVINLGGTIHFFLENSFNYPTLAEAYKVAALDAWNRLIFNPSFNHQAA